MLRLARNKAYQLILLQLLVVAVLFIVWWLFKDIKAGYSAFLGGLAGIIPSIYFVHKFFTNKKRTPQKIITDFYIGEIIKLLASAILLVLIVKFIPIHILPLITGFIGAYLSIWLTPLLNMY